MTSSPASAALRPEHYNAIAKILHWLVALMIFGIIPAGIIMSDLKEGALQDSLFFWHESFGMLVFLLVLARLANRRIAGAPAPDASLNRFERIASTATHHTLYLLLTLVPLIGWIAVSAYGGRPAFFGLFEVPAILGANQKLAETLFDIHGIAGKVILFGALFHIAGALKHWLISRDGVIYRMLPRGK